MLTRHYLLDTILLIFGTLAVNVYAHLGSCEDHAPQCRIWAVQGHCNYNLQFMASNCPVSCNLCLDPGCFDRSPMCTAWANRGYCFTHRSQLQATCPHSCDFCKIDLGTVLTTKSIATPDFQCGRPLGGGSTSVRFGRRAARQVLFPPEYEEFLRTGMLPTTPRTLMRLGVQPPAVPINTIQVGDAFCGSTVIHEQYLITAAHCVIDPARPVRTVRVGELDFANANEANSRPQDYEVERIIVHPDYKPNSLERYNDIALVKTVEKMQFNEAVYPMCISSSRPAPNTVVTGSGFGFVNNTDRSTILQQAELVIRDSRECEAIYQREGFGNVIRSRFPQLLQGRDILCASYPGRDACQGDSGGPLFRDDPASGRRYLVGIVGLGVSCRGNGISILPGFYISVADHIDFINGVIYQ